MASERNNSLLRTLDRHIGIPIVAVLGALRRFRRRSRPAKVRRIGLLKTAGIGDTVLLSAIARDIAALPDTELYIFTGRANAAAARLIRGVTEVVELPMTRPHLALRQIRKYPVDVLLDCGPWPRINAILAALSRARFTAGFRTPGQHRHFAYDHVVDHSRNHHEIDNYRRLAASVGIPVGSEPVLRRGEQVPRALLPMRPFVVCHMWSAGFKGSWKEWPAASWQVVIETLVADGHDVVLTGSADDRDATAAFHRTLNAASARVHDLSGKLDLAQTVELLRRSELVLSVNTGIMHMAAVVGTPTLSLEGPTPLHRWGPRGEQVASVVSPHPGAGYLHLGWEYEGQPSDTMDAITPDSVLKAARSMLGDEGRISARSHKGRKRELAGRQQRVAGGDSSTLAS